MSRKQRRGSGTPGNDPAAPSFADLVGAVDRRIEADEPPATQKPPPRRRARDAGEDAQDDTSAAHNAWREPREDLPEITEFRHPGMPLSQFRKLRRGQFAIVDEVDLHGLNTQAARARLDRFLHGARGNELRCVRIIHGKGLGSPGFEAVLKPRVRQWLADDARVLAFVEARAGDGGSGAVYALLRARRD